MRATSGRCDPTPVAAAKTRVMMGLTRILWRQGLAVLVTKRGVPTQPVSGIARLSGGRAAAYVRG